MKQLFFLFLLITILSPPTFAGEADVLKVSIDKRGDNTYNFRVTVKHGDTGWDHYADKWDIIDDKGTVLGTRTLLHPHVNEQPFTRSLSNITISAPLTRVTVRAHDSVHGYGGKTVTIQLP